MRVGIVGLPQSGKTTLFNAITGAHGDTSGYHAGPQVAHGMVRVPDERLSELAGILSPKEVIPATIEFEDVGGVFAHVAGGERSGQAVAALRDTDAILMVLRSFEAEHVVEVLGGIDPVREYHAVDEELLLADLEVIEKRLETIAGDIRKNLPGRDELVREEGILQRCAEAVESERDIRAVGLSDAEEKLLRSYAFLTVKPMLCVLNIGEDAIGSAEPPEGLANLEPSPIPVCAELEMELMDLPEDERSEFAEDAGLSEPASGRIIRACYDLCGLRSFFTHVSDQLRAWTVEGRTLAPQAAGKIHTDMERGFVRAEVVSFDDLVACGGLKEAKSAGKLRMEGKDYEVRDGDVITIHFTR